MFPNLFCPTCKQKNEATATECVYCGSPLHRPHTTTINVSSSGATASSTTNIIAPDIPEGSFALSIPIPDKETVTLIEDRSLVLLGRPTSPEKTQPNLIDLTSYNAIEFGVSRSHAKITKTETGYVIEDMGSVNGTWLNRTRLIPTRQYLLRNGDEIRLGKLWIHFHSKPKTADLPNTPTT